MKTIITYGTFDTFHYGHLELLTRAANLGDKLIVAVSTDQFNKNKGKTSIFSYKKRKSWVESIKFVDLVISETCWEQKESDIKMYSVDTLVMGDDWKGKFDFLSCQTVYLPRTETISSTAIKDIL